MEFPGAHPRRRVAVDAVHVRHPARRAHRDPAARLRGGGARRRRAWQTFWHITVPYLAPMMLLAVTFRLLDAIRLFDTIFIMTGGGPGTQTYSTSVLSLHDRLHAVPPVAGDRRRVDIPGPDAARHRVPGAAPLETGGEMTMAPAAPRRRRRTAHPDRPHPCSSASSLPSCWRRSIGCSSPRSSRATTISPCRRSGSRRADDGALHRRALRLSRPPGADQQPHHLGLGDRALVRRSAR